MLLGLGCARDNPEFGLGAKGATGGTTGATDEASEGVAGPTDGDGTTGNSGGNSGTGSTPDATTAGTVNEDDDDDDEIKLDVGVECELLIECGIFTGECAPGMKCAPADVDGDFAADGTFCLTAGNATHGERCTFSCGVDTCDETSACLPLLDDPNGGVCVEYCDPVAGKGGVCPFSCVGVGPGFGLCHECNPVAQDCDFRDACYLDPTGFVCSPLGTGQPGDVCFGTDDCDAGIACVPGALVPGCPDGESCCVTTCNPMGGPCASGAGCVALNPTPGFPIGLCLG